MPPRGLLPFQTIRAVFHEGRNLAEPRHLSHYIPHGPALSHIKLTVSPHSGLPKRAGL
jgi:hypothetical protein